MIYELASEKLRQNMAEYIGENTIANITPLIEEHLQLSNKSTFVRQYKQAIKKLVPQSIQELNEKLIGVVENPRTINHKQKKEEYYRWLLTKLIVYEWYLVTEDLSDILGSHNEIILKYWNMYIWGRQVTGIPIEKDKLFWSFVEELPFSKMPIL
jgi:hypothetical protein